MSRIFDFRSTGTARRPHERADSPPEEKLRELLRERRERLEVFEAGPVAVGVVRAELRRHDLLELRGLLLGSGLERAQVPRLDAVARELEARGHDVHVPLGIPPLTAVRGRIEQPVVLEVAHEGGRRARPFAERLEVEVLLGLAETHARPGLAPRRSELLADDAERQKLVALQAKDRLEPVDVVLREEPVAALRAPRREEALVLEVADLGDGDVGELVLEPPADRADRERPLSRPVGLDSGDDGGHRPSAPFEEGEPVLADLHLRPRLRASRSRPCGG